MNGEQEPKINAETPYDLGVKGETFQENVNEMMKSDITHNNFKSVEKEYRNLGLNIDNTIQFIENEFQAIQKQIEHELTIAKKVGFLRDNPYYRATELYKKWVGMFKTNSNLRNLMFEMHIAERQKLYDLVRRTSIMDKEIAKFKAEKEVLKDRKEQDDQIIKTLANLVEEQKKLTTKLSQVIQPTLPDDLIESIKELKKVMESSQPKQTQAQPSYQPSYKQPQFTQPAEEPFKNLNEPLEEIEESEPKTNAEIVEEYLSRMEKSQWRSKIFTGGVRYDLTKLGLTNEEINEAWDKIKRKHLL